VKREGGPSLLSRPGPWTPATQWLDDYVRYRHERSVSENAQLHGHATIQKIVSAVCWHNIPG
jgi:hypothetical protein